MRGLLLNLSLGFTLLVACGSPEPGAPEPVPYMPPAASAIVDASPVAIRREVIKVQVPAPPPNPDATANGDTPPAYNFVRLVRYRLDSQPALPARAIAVLVPGFLGGALSYDALARALVRRSTPDAAIEAWAIDRRANLLEDQHGMDVAEVRGDPELAASYYFNGTPLEGKTYDGVMPQESLAFMSEWGLASTIADLRAVIDLVPAAERKTHVVLVGHSLGASIVEEYAAWDFAGAPGYDDLAALVLIDGATGAEGRADIPITRQEYEEGFGAGSFQRIGLRDIRKSQRYFVLPLLGSDVYLVAAMSGLRAAHRPLDVTSDSTRDGAMRVLLGLSQVPDMTNRAALGFAFDRAYTALSFAAVSCGEGSGGPIEPYHSVLGDDLLHPTDLNSKYDWVDYDKSRPTGNTALGELAQSWFLGPELDFAEWYFPNRLSLDPPAAGNLILTTDDWPRKDYGLRAAHGRTMDMPILGVAASLVGKGKGDTTAFDALRTLVAATPIGPGRVQQGLPRTSGDAFKVLGYPQLTHIDPLMGADSPVSQAHGWYDSLYNFIMLHTAKGPTTVQLPKP